MFDIYELGLAYPLTLLTTWYALVNHICAIHCNYLHNPM